RRARGLRHGRQRGGASPCGSLLTVRRSGRRTCEILHEVGCSDPSQVAYWTGPATFFVRPTRAAAVGSGSRWARTSLKHDSRAWAPTVNTPVTCGGTLSVAGLREAFKRDGALKRDQGCRVRHKCPELGFYVALSYDS